MNYAKILHIFEVDNHGKIPFSFVTYINCAKLMCQIICFHCEIFMQIMLINTFIISFPYPFGTLTNENAFRLLIELLSPFARHLTLHLFSSN